MFNTLKLEDIKNYLIELLIGLKSLKEVGIFHRDIKPGNFLYNRQKKCGIIIDFGLAEIDPTYEGILKSQRENLASQGVNVRALDDKIVMYEKLRQCLKIIGSNKIGTESYMPMQSILHHSNQTYQSDIWPVGIILLQFVLKKYNIFNHLKCTKKIGDLKNPYFIYYFLEIATLFGKEQVVKQAEKLGYNLQLPADIKKIDLKPLIQLQGYNEQLEDLLFKLLQLDAEKRISVDEAIGHSFFDGIRKQHFPTGKKK